MNRPRLSKSGIEYLDYAWNFYSGCLNGQNGVCPVGENCWAKETTVRFKGHYPNGFEPTFYPESFLSPLSLKKPARIGCAFMGDLFGDWVDPHQIVHPECAYLPNRYTSEARNWSLDILVKRIITDCPQHRFLFLTKNPEGLKAWSPFPDNCWVGVTATNPTMFATASYYLRDVEAKMKYLSFEPLLQRMKCDRDFEKRTSHYFETAGINWVIIGAQTKPTIMPKIEWIEEITRAADNAGIPIFHKNNLKPLFPGINPTLRQELPV